MTKWWNYNIFVQIWYSYFGYTGRLFLGCAIFIAVRLSQLYERWRRNKDWATEESALKNLCEGHHFFDFTRSFLCQFLLPYSFTTLPKWRIYWMVPIKIHIAIGGNLCYAEKIKISCHLILLWLLLLLLIVFIWLIHCTWFFVQI